ncbi:MAG TPA: ABC transporter permease subunit [Anaerolineales bacterium]|nr:ABC transporter permease subunit [Anaerolineales bacterium]
MTYCQYGNSVERAAGRAFWFTCMILTLMLPYQVQFISQYILFNKLGRVNTYLPLLVPRFFGQAFFIFLIMQFIRGIPREVNEAAEIEGCSQIDIFVRIILPLINPALILEDPTLQLVISAAIPCEHAPLGIRVMSHGKDCMSDKTGFTSLEQLDEVRRVQAETGRICSICFSERFESAATVKAGELVRVEAIGRSIPTSRTGRLW